jgi:uncharacterized repeat protein (TIGR03803 family)
MMAMNGETMTMQPLNNLRLLAWVSALAFAAVGVSGAQAQTYTDLHDFDTPTLASPQYEGILAQGRDGNLYGTTPVGGDFGRGGVYQITPSGAYTVIHSFDSTRANPYSGLTMGADGNFYGGTYNGGDFGFGTVFQITPGGSVTVLHSFSLVEGAGPYAPPIQGADGNFYGTTTIGGLGYGAVYKVTPAGGFTVLYRFDLNHGSSPFAPLIQAKDGNFYGTTVGGGTADFGTAFKITPAGALTVLYNFDSTHGSGPYAPLVQGSDGNFYGTARAGGTKNNGGVAFKLTATKKLTVLYNFDATGATTDGVRPYAGLIQASDGNFYSVASAGGTNAAGTLYRITKAGVYSTLHNFTSATGSLPFATLIQLTNGKFYGQATSGGGLGHGAFFSFDLGLKPFITLRPTSGVVGQSVDILGQGLSQSTSVRFTPNVPANASVFADSYMSTIVPANATTGTVKVLLTHGQLTSNQKFLVTPVVVGLSPASGPVGAAVVITGDSFTGASKVTFSGVKALVFSVDSYTQITATVPTGAKTGKIQVTTPGGIATSPTDFTVN